jgi:hypothetical protein
MGRAQARWSAARRYCRADFPFGWGSSGLKSRWNAAGLVGVENFIAEEVWVGSRRCGAVAIGWSALRTMVALRTMCATEALMSNTQLASVTVRIDRATRDRLAREAAQDRRPLSQHVRNILDDALRDREPTAEAR